MVEFEEDISIRDARAVGLVILGLGFKPSCFTWKFITLWLICFKERNCSGSENKLPVWFKVSGAYLWEYETHTIRCSKPVRFKFYIFMTAIL